MSRTQVRNLLVAAAVTAVVGILTMVVVATTLKDSQTLASAGWLGSFWVNLLAGPMAAILAARKSAEPFEDPRMGRVIGTAMGLWSGIGAMIGQIVTGLFASLVYKLMIVPGQVIFFAVILLVVCVIAASIAGREAAQPKETEEE